MGIEILGNLKNPDVIVIGVFHGDEPQGEFLIRKYIEKKQVSNLLFVPKLNHNNSRVNANGVDLNRNFPTQNWELTEKNEYFGGIAPASEVETKFVIKLVEKYSPKAIITLHAPYKVVNYYGPAEDLAKKISDIINYPVEPSIGYPTPGSFGTWAGIERNILTITLELDEEIDIKELEPKAFDVFEYLEGI
jgi:protein MpaA